MIHTKILQAMKTLSIVFLICSFSFCVNAHNESVARWPKQSSSISIFASTLLFASVINLSYEHLYFTGKNHFGFTTGYTNGFYTAEEFIYLPGIHGALTFLSGTRLKHFEAKVGATVFLGFDEDEYGKKHLEKLIIPVISVGCRRQLSNSNSFFRWAVSTAGFGIGFGYVFGR